MQTLHFNIIGKSNGVGLSRDIGILDAALCSAGHLTNVVLIDRKEAGRRRSILASWRLRFARARKSTSDVRKAINIMLEHVWPQYLHQAELNILIPNPEWCDRRDRKLIPSISHVWSKTLHSKALFDSLGSRTQLIGFDSNDRYLPHVRRERSFLHVAGKSTMKGTARLVDVWRRHPEWPTLTIVRHGASEGASSVAPNIHHICGYLDDTSLRELQNSNVFHLCPSQTEGWGHYIVEGLSASAVVITVDAPPMNELVDPTRGLLVPYSTIGTQHLAYTYDFNDEALESTVGRALAMSDAECAVLGARARSWYLTNKRLFPARIVRALKHLPPL